MKHMPSRSQSLRQLTSRSHPRPIGGPEGIAIAPPAYGIDFVDRHPAPVIQTKPLTLGPVDDKYEREADRIAQQVVGHSASTAEPQEPFVADSTVMRLPTESGAVGGPVNPEVEAGIRRARGGGRPLPDAVRAPMERALGADFGGVRVHTDARADALNQSLQARAFTTGRDIFFGRHTFDPASRQGQTVLAHELTHVVQQSSGSAPPSIQRLMSASKFKKKTNLAARKGKSASAFRGMKTGLRAYEQSGAYADLAGVYDQAQEWLSTPGAATSSRKKYVERLVRELELEIGFPPELVQTLQDAFVIIPPLTFPTHPNEVTADEFSQVATLLYRIFAGLGKLSISPELKDEVLTELDFGRGRVAEIKHELKVETMKDVIKVAQTVTGRDLLATVADAADDVAPVSIAPNELVVDPTAKQKNKLLAGPQAATVTYTPGEYKTEKAQNSAENMERLRETARYNPWVTPHRSDITLYHELVHAFHIQTGTAKSFTQFVGSQDSDIQPVDDVDAPRMVTGLGGQELTGVTEEEYYTVGLGPYEDERFTENQYRRERLALGEEVHPRTYYANKAEPVKAKKKRKRKGR